MLPANVIQPSTLIWSDGTYGFFNDEETVLKTQIPSKEYSDFLVQLMLQVNHPASWIEKARPTTETKTRFAIFKNIENSSQEEFESLMKDPFSPPMPACLHEAIRANNIEVIEYICKKYLCDMHTCIGQKCDKDHEMINISQLVTVPDQDNFMGEDEENPVSALQLALMNPSRNENDLNRVLNVLLKHGANANPMEYEYLDEDDEDYIEPEDDSSGYHSFESVECQNRYFWNPILNCAVSRLDPNLTHFLIKNGAKKNHTYNIQEHCLIKQEFLDPNESNLYAEVKKEFISTKAKINFFFMCKFNPILNGLPRELVYKILTDKVITPYHKRITIAKMELRAEKKQKFDVRVLFILMCATNHLDIMGKIPRELKLMILTPEEFTTPYYHLITLTKSQIRERKERYAECPMELEN